MVPFVSSLPAFAMLLHKDKLTPRERGEFINKLFHIHLYVSLAVSLVFLHITSVTTLVGSGLLLLGQNETALLVVIPTLLIVIILVLGVFKYYANVYGELRRKIG
ncbi:MAG: hypothetical protein DRJ59_04760 [Thermoprotei archaeon]|nr:MAG: hypothetical protein DRJ59_04760 [Thermoprotei archaeon]